MMRHVDVAGSLLPPDRRHVYHSSVASNIFRPRAFVTAHPNLFDRGQERLDNWLRYREQNGLTELGAVFTRGKLLFIDAEKFVAWLKAESLEGQS